MSYLSHDKNSGEVHVDKYNIDFLRYYTWRDFILDIIGSFLGLVFWTNIIFLFEWTLVISLFSLYSLYVIGGVLFFIFCFFVAYGATQHKKESIRIAGRRGLFTFTVLVLMTLLYLISVGYITWNQLFIDFLRYMMIGMIGGALLALPFSYGFSFVLGLFKKKRD